MAINKNFINNNFINNNGTQAQAAQAQAQAAQAQTVKGEGMLFEWGTPAVPSGEEKVLVIRTTVSGKNVTAPDFGGASTGGRVTTCWPGQILWSSKGTEWPRLFLALSALAAEREANGKYKIENGNYVFQPDQNGLDMHLLKEDEVDQSTLQGLMAKGDAESLSKAMKMLETGSMKRLRVSPAEFVKVSLGGKKPIPTKFLVNLPGREDVHADLLEALMDLDGEPGILEIHLPFTKLSTFSSKEDLKYKDDQGVLQTQKNEDGVALKQAIFKWGNSNAPIAFVGLKKGFLPKQQDDSRKFSLEYTRKACDQMTRQETAEEALRREKKKDLNVWKWNTIDELRDASGNKWHEQAGVYPSPGQTTCEMWDDFEISEKRDLWIQMLYLILEDGTKKQPYRCPAGKASSLNEEGVKALIDAAESRSLWGKPTTKSTPETPTPQEQKAETDPKVSEETPKPESEQTKSPAQQEGTPEEDDWVDCGEASMADLLGDVM